MANGGLVTPNTLKNVDNSSGIGEQSVEMFIEQLEDSPNVVFLDPPRNGFTEKFMKQLDHLKSEKIVYISCNPSTQARDIAFLKHYQIKKIVPVDNFPFTKHVENVILLTRK